jgi:ATP-dependent DNA ligase
MEPGKSMDLPIDPPVLPMLAKRIDKLPTGSERIYEPKWDGFRTLIFRDAKELLIQSRDEKSLNRYFPELLEPLLGQLPKKFVLDGEIVIATNGTLNFDALQLRIHPAASRVRLLRRQTPASIVFFDLLAEGKDDWRNKPFLARRTKLEPILSKVKPPIHITPATDDPAVASGWFQRFEGAGLDGVMAKAKHSVYESDKRICLK